MVVAYPRFYQRIFLAGLRKTTKHLRQDSQYAVRNFNSALPVNKPSSYRYANLLGAQRFVLKATNQQNISSTEEGSIRNSLYEKLTVIQNEAWIAQSVQ
jgi:hypothetical protein